MIRLWFRAIALIAGFFLSSGSVLAAPEVVIGYANISARVSPLWLAQEKGFFAKYGVNVQQVYMPGSPVMIASMASGQVHLANSGGTAALGAAAGGLDLRVIGTFTSHIPFDLVVKPNIKSPKVSVASTSAYRSSAVQFGWARCSGSNTWGSTHAVTTSRSWPRVPNDVE